MIDVKIQAHMPSHLVRKFLQHIRDIEQQHPADITVAVIFRNIEKSEFGMSIEEMENVLQSVRPPFPSGIVHFKLQETGWPMDKDKDIN